MQPRQMGADGRRAIGGPRDEPGLSALRRCAPPIAWLAASGRRGTTLAMTPVWQSPAMGRTPSRGPGACCALLRPHGAEPPETPQDRTSANRRCCRETGARATDRRDGALGGADAVGDPSHGVKVAPMWAARAETCEGVGAHARAVPTVQWQDSRPKLRRAWLRPRAAFLRWTEKPTSAGDAARRHTGDGGEIASGRAGVGRRGPMASANALAAVACNGDLVPRPRNEIARPMRPARSKQTPQRRSRTVGIFPHVR